MLIIIAINRDFVNDHLSLDLRHVLFLYFTDFLSLPFSWSLFIVYPSFINLTVSKWLVYKAAKMIKLVRRK